MARPKGQTLQQRFGFQDSDLTTPQHDEMMLWLDENIDTVLSEFLKKPTTAKQVLWECPVRTGGGYLIGFADMFVLTDDGNFVCIEVKTKIPSLGELIRQINMYRERHNRIGNVSASEAYFVIVAPDDRFAPLLEKQGIGYVKYQP